MAVLNTSNIDWSFLGDAAQYEQSLDQRAFDTIVDMGRYIEQQRGPARPVLTIKYDFSTLQTLPQQGQPESVGLYDMPSPKPKPTGHSELTRELDID